MAKTHVENLRVYQLSETLSDQVCHIVIMWEHLAKTTVGPQLVRSADSIGANLGEVSGRGSDADYKRFIWIASGWLHKIRHWLRRAFQRKLLNDQQVAMIMLLY